MICTSSFILHRTEFCTYAVGQKSRKQKDANYRGVKSRASAE